MRTALDMSDMWADFNRSNALKRLPVDAPDSGVKTVAVVEMKTPPVTMSAKRPNPFWVELAPDMIADAELFLLATDDGVFET